jgi:hypothetical protein
MKTTLLLVARRRKSKGRSMSGKSRREPEGEGFCSMTTESRTSRLTREKTYAFLGGTGLGIAIVYVFFGVGLTANPLSLLGAPLAIPQLEFRVLALFLLGVWIASLLARGAWAWVMPGVTAAVWTMWGIMIHGIHV